MNLFNKLVMERCDIITIKTDDYDKNNNVLFYQLR